MPVQPDTIQVDDTSLPGIDFQQVQIALTSGPNTASGTYNMLRLLRLII